MSRIIERALSIINDNLKDQTSSFADPISIKPMARGGRLLEDDYPTHYLPHVGRQVMADGGDADPVGGALDVAQSISETPMPSLRPTPPAPSVPSAEGRVVKKDTRPRMMNDIGHYSAAAEAASALKQEKGPASQMIGALKNMPGVKPEEIKWSGVESAFDPKEMITKDDLVNHFNKSLPEIKETKLGRDRIHLIQNEEEPHIFEVYHAGDPEGQHYGQVGEIVKNPAGRYTINVPGVSKHNFATIEEAKDYINNASDIGTTTKFHGYALPGGDNYREVLLHLPDKRVELSNAIGQARQERDAAVKQHGSKPYYEDKEEEQGLLAKIREATKREMDARSKLENLPNNFKSTHWNEPNILAHLRMSDRTGENGEKILHLEELQSDWAQKAREVRKDEVKRLMREKGLEKEEASKLVPSDFGLLTSEKSHAYNDHMKQLAEAQNESKRLMELAGQKLGQKNPTYQDAIKVVPELEEASNRQTKLTYGIPEKPEGITAAPYIANTQNWVDLGLKRALREAAKGGYDKLIWTPGKEQAERYDLSKHIKSVTYDPNEQHLSAIGHDGREVLSESGVEPHELDEHVGKEVAEKLRREADNATSAFNEYEIHKDPETKKWGLNLYGEPHYDYGGDEVLFDSKSEAQDYLREMVDEDIKRNPPTISGLDLKVGGEGMHAFYDKMVPTQLSKMVKKFDPSAKIEMGAHKLENEDGKEVKAHVLHITPELRQKILDGLPAYAQGGEVDGDDGISAYHGSPYEFNEFDTSKIGTGEGAQAYGHGLYFAENPEVAQAYRSRLAGRPEIKGLTLAGHTVGPQNGFDYTPKTNSTYENLRSSLFEDLLINEDALLADPSNVKNLAINTLKERMKDLPDEWPEAVPHAEKLLKDINRANGAKLKLGETPGKMYEVRLNMGPEHLLHWDKPLSEQHPEVQKALSKHPLSRRLFGNDVVKGELTEPTGESILNRLIGKPHEKSEQLLNMGIRGIRYLDAGSRGQDGHTGSHNIVVFDPQHIKIKRKYAKGGEIPNRDDEGIVAYAFGNSIPHLDKIHDEMPEALPQKSYGGALIPGPKLTEENADDFARRLIAWTFATAPLFHKASGGSVIDDPLDVISKLRR